MWTLHYGQTGDTQLIENLTTFNYSLTANCDQNYRSWRSCFFVDFEVLYNPRQWFHWSDCVPELSEDSEHSLHHRHFCRKSETEIFRKISFINNICFISVRIDILLRTDFVWIWNWFATTVTRRSAVQTYFNNRANVDTYMTLLNL